MQITAINKKEYCMHWFRENIPHITDMMSLGFCSGGTTYSRSKRTSK